MELKDLEPFLEKIVKIDRTKEIPTDPKSSYLGGYPYVPSNIQSWEWPRTKNGNPLQFIVQINFKDVPKGVGYPKAGLLQVFVDLEDYDGTSEGFKVIFLNETELSFESKSKPSDIGPSIEEEFRAFWKEYSPKSIDFRESLQISAATYQVSSWSTDGENLEESEKKLYDLLEESGGDVSKDLVYLAEYHHQLGGQPFWIQHPMLSKDEVPTFMLQISSDGIDEDDFLTFVDDGNLHIFGDLEKLRSGDVSEFFWEWASY